jgi:hypothetical protein
LHIQKYNHEEKYSSLKFSISFQVVKFISNVLKTFVNALCYNNDEDYMIFLSCKMFLHWKCKWAKCCFYQFIQKNGFRKLLKNDNMMSNKDFKSMFIKLFLYFYTMIQLPINCILMGIFRRFQNEWNLTCYFLYYM